MEKEHHISPAILLTARDADILDLSLPSSMNRDIKAIGPIPKITGRRRRNNHGLMPVRNRKCREKEEARARNRRSVKEERRRIMKPIPIKMESSNIFPSL